MSAQGVDERMMKCTLLLLLLLFLLLVYGLSAPFFSSVFHLPAKFTKRFDHYDLKIWGSVWWRQNISVVEKKRITLGNQL